MTDRLATAKRIIFENFEDGKYGLFNTRNSIGDSLGTLYYEDGLEIDICYDYMYFEVFGLTATEFAELSKYYVSLGGM